MKYLNISSFFLRENERVKERLSTRKNASERERVSSLNTCQRENHGSSHSPLKGRVLWGTLGIALMVLVTLVVLVACPAANNAANGGPGPGPSPDEEYVCANGTAVDGTTDTAGQTRCVSCDTNFVLSGVTCVRRAGICFSVASGGLLIGTANDNTLSSTTADNELYGCGGTDTYVFAANFGMDSIGSDMTTDSELEGEDTIQFDSATALSFGYITGTTHVTIGQGSGHTLTIYEADRILGSTTSRVSGPPGAVDFKLRHGGTTYNVMVGTTGDDIGGGPSNPVLVGTPTPDIIIGLDGDDFIGGAVVSSGIPGTNNDILVGGAGADDLRGRQGDDLLIGGPGNDRLFGGGGDNGSFDDANGADIFRFGSNFGTDTIGFYGGVSSTMALGIDSTDRLEFTDTGTLTLSWNADNDLTIAQGSDSVLVYRANRAFGFTIVQGSTTEAVDSTTDLMVDGM